MRQWKGAEERDDSGVEGQSCKGRNGDDDSSGGARAGQRCRIGGDRRHRSIGVKGGKKKSEARDMAEMEGGRDWNGGHARHGIQKARMSGIRE